MITLPRHKGATQSAYILQLLLLLIAFFTPGKAVAQDTASNSQAGETGDRVILSKGRNLKQTLSNYNHDIIELALKKTVASHGPFRLEEFEKSISNVRALHEVSKAQGAGKINLHITVSSKERGAIAHAIKVPLRFGLLSYRLLVVKKENLETFSKIKTTADLRKYRLGSGQNWISTEILEQQSFPIIEIQQFNSMYRMLDMGRFDFLLRGVNEIYDEKRLFAKDFENLALVPGIAVFMPVHYYAFVNKSNTRLRERLETGFNRAINDGSAALLFEQYYGSYIKNAEMKYRHIIHIKNQSLVGDTVSENLNYWYVPNPQIESAILSYVR